MHFLPCASAGWQVWADLAPHLTQVAAVSIVNGYLFSIHSSSYLSEQNSLDPITPSPVSANPFSFVVVVFYLSHLRSSFIVDSSWTFSFYSTPIICLSQLDISSLIPATQWFSQTNVFSPFCLSQARLVSLLNFLITFAFDTAVPPLRQGGSSFVVDSSRTFSFYSTPIICLSQLVMLGPSRHSSITSLQFRLSQFIFTQAFS